MRDFAIAILLAAICASQVMARPITPQQYRAHIGPCACPDDRAADHSWCGGRSAYCRCRAWEPTCFAGDDTGLREATRQRLCGHVCPLSGLKGPTAKMKRDQ